MIGIIRLFAQLSTAFAFHKAVSVETAEGLYIKQYSDD
ncbi:hypothetical protein SynBIOSE41_02102 [Synechococcus sp. BIOS-E4-1]|nr:hypothetical protein SynBIOSE41_02102 [Synechococcus sp. BIOS-E4-1]